MAQARLLRLSNKRQKGRFLAGPSLCVLSMATKTTTKKESRTANASHSVEASRSAKATRDGSRDKPQDKPQSNNHEAQPRIRIKIRAYDHKIIDRSAKTIIESAERSGAKVCGPIPLPTEKRKYTVNRSSFIHKNAREQFEMRTHKRLIDILQPTDKTTEALTGLNLPAGVDVEIKMV